MMGLKSQLTDLVISLKDFDVEQLADINRSGVWPLPVKVLAWLLVLAAVLVAGWLLLVSGSIAQLDRAQQLEAQLSLEQEQKRQQAEGLERHQLRHIQLQQDFEALLMQLPSDTEIPGLIEDMTQAGLSNGLVIGSIDLGAEVRHEFHVEKPVHLVLEGSYHQLSAFVRDIASLPRIVTLHDFTISLPAIAQGQAGAAGQLSMKIHAKTYRYDGHEGAAGFQAHREPLGSSR